MGILKEKNFEDDYCTHCPATCFFTYSVMSTIQARVSAFIADILFRNRMVFHHVVVHMYSGTHLLMAIQVAFGFSYFK